MAFCYLGPAVRDRFRPLQAGWHAGEDVHASYYGPPLRIASSAWRFDLSPAWFSFVGAAPALELLNEIRVEQVYAHDTRLANRFRDGLGMPAGGSAIVSVDVPGADEKLAAAGVRAAVRAGRVRASFHLYTTDKDVDLALDALPVNRRRPVRSSSPAVPRGEHGPRRRAAQSPPGPWPSVTRTSLRGPGPPATPNRKHRAPGSAFTGRSGQPDSPTAVTRTGDLVGRIPAPPNVDPTGSPAPRSDRVAWFSAPAPSAVGLALPTYRGPAG